MNRNCKILCVLISFLIVFSGLSFSQSSSNPKIRTVVIDPGHGGRDPGAVGKFSFEKDIVLAIALKLKDKIEANHKDVKVILTRDKDVFLELFKRAEIANKANADLFISIHINASSNPKAHGTETFVMGLHKNAGNLEVAKLENSVILKEDDYEDKYGGFDPNDPESQIIFSLFQNAHLHQSLFMAQLTQDNFSNNLKLFNRGVKQAGFLVLWKTAMPSILVEAGFISNPAEEEYINTKEGQEKITLSIYQAFAKYKKYYEDDELEPEIKKEATTIKEPVIETVIPKLNADTISVLIEKPDSKLEKITMPASTNNIVFKVQISTSTKKIEIIPKNFKGYENVEVYLLNDIYRYTIGSDSDFDKVNALQKELRKDFPDCFVIAFKNGERYDVNQARREMKK